MGIQNTKWLEVFAKVSGWIAAPVVIALFAGRYLDNKYETKPWITLTLIGLSFAVSLFGIIKESLKYIKEIEKK
jgi:F0F1-type ATP synthase assembly protein I